MSGTAQLMRSGLFAAGLAALVVAANCGGSPTAPSGPALGLTCPAAVEVVSPDRGPVPVTFDTPVATGGSPPSPVTCNPASGASFPVGVTTVACSARDSAGRTASCAIPVTVKNPPNVAPVITALTLSTTTTEINGAVQAQVTVQDAETSADQLKYEWTADRGTFTGEGASLVWHAANEPQTPVDARLTVTVVESYEAVGVAGVAAEHRVSKTSDPIRVHNSTAEISSLVTTFLGDFANSLVSPEVTVRNFSDSCRGKADELSDVQYNRQNYRILSSSFHVERVTIKTPYNWAEIDAPCAFTSLKLATGETEKVAGTCKLTTTYEQRKWWLCDSHFSGSLIPSFRSFFGIR